MLLITSPSNPRISKLKDLHTVRGRKQSGLFLMEGPHLLEVLLNTQILPHEVYYQPVLLQRTAKGKQLLDRLLQNSSLSLIEVSERVIEAIGEVQASQGVISVLSLDAFSPAQVRKRRPTAQRSALLILDDLADPGNDPDCRAGPGHRGPGRQSEDRGPGQIHALHTDGDFRYGRRHHLALRLRLRTSRSNPIRPAQRVPGTFQHTTPVLDH